MAYDSTKSPPKRYNLDPSSRYARSDKIDCPRTRPSFIGSSDRSQVTVEKAGKPPKLRFKPGTYIELEGQLYEVMYAYRVHETPQEWQFFLEERKKVDEPLDFIGEMMDSLGVGSSTPRVVYEIFRNHSDVYTFFADIPRNGDSRQVSNKTMLKGKVVTIVERHHEGG